MQPPPSTGNLITYIKKCYWYHHYSGMYIPIIWRLLSPTRFPGSLLRSGKHWTLVPSSAKVAVPLRVAVKDVTFAPNPAPAAAMKALPGPHEEEAPASLCARRQSLTPLPTLQTVNPFMSPSTVQVKVKVSSGQVGGAGVNCPATSPGEEKKTTTRHTCATC